MMIIEQYQARSDSPIPAVKHRIEVITDIAGPGKAGNVTVRVDGKEVATTTLTRTVPAAFSASETFDIGVDLGSTVALDYFDWRPFSFSGAIASVKVSLGKPAE